MLQVRIDDPQLENRIRAKARQAGQTEQEFIRAVLMETVATLQVPKLDPLQHGKRLENEVSGAEDLDAIRLFEDPTDAPAFAKQLRQQAWR